MRKKMALSIQHETEPAPQKWNSDRLMLRRGDLARKPADTEQDLEHREPEEIFAAIFPETHEDEGITGSD
jgi:hypothetical protein